jgi:hypothetical protein
MRKHQRVILAHDMEIGKLKLVSILDLHFVTKAVEEPSITGLQVRGCRRRYISKGIGSIASKSGRR